MVRHRSSLLSLSVTVRFHCIAVSELNRKVGADVTATALQPGHQSIVVLLVGNAAKGKKPKEAWAWMLLLAERESAYLASDSVR